MLMFSKKINKGEDYLFTLSDMFYIGSRLTKILFVKCAICLSNINNSNNSVDRTCVGDGPPKGFRNKSVRVNAYANTSMLAGIRVDFEFIILRSKL